MTLAARATASSLVLIILLGVSALVAPAATIVSISDPVDDVGQSIIIPPGGDRAAMAVGFSIVDSYVNVEITANLFCADCQGIVYLTTEFGAAAQPGSVIALDEFDSPSDPLNTPLFSGLSLGPGNYFLVFGVEPDSASTVSLSWIGGTTVATGGGPGTALIELATGAAHLGDFFASSSQPLAYTSNFLVIDNVDLHYTVSGDLVNGEPPPSEVPEPSTWLLSAAGISVFALLRRRAK